MDLNPPPGTFNPWGRIGTGKLYTEAPYYVSLARDEVSVIPADVVQLFPARDEPISGFVKRRLPKKSIGFNTYRAEAWFSIRESMSRHNEDTQRGKRETVT